MGKTDIVDAGHFVRKEEIYRKGSTELVKFGITNLKSIQGRNNKPLKSLKKYVKKKKKNIVIRNLVFPVNEMFHLSNVWGWKRNKVQSKVKYYWRCPEFMQ